MIHRVIDCSNKVFLLKKTKTNPNPLRYPFCLKQALEAHVREKLITELKRAMLTGVNTELDGSSSEAGHQRVAWHSGLMLK